MFRQTLDQFEIPKLLKEREQAKLMELSEREETDVSQIEKGVTEEEMDDMKNLDSFYGLS